MKEYSMKSISLDIPIAMLDINGKPLLQRQVETLHKVGVTDIKVVGGYKSKLIDVEGVTIVDNKHYQSTGPLYSVFCAEKHMKERVLIIYGDVLFDDEIFRKLLTTTEDITILVDGTFDSKNYCFDKTSEFIISVKAPLKTRRRINGPSLSKVLRISERIPVDEAHYEWAGALLLSSRGIEIYKEVYHKSKNKYRDKPFHDADKFEKTNLGSLLQEIIDSGYSVHCLPVDSGWIEVHCMDDYKLACSMVS